MRSASFEPMEVDRVSIGSDHAGVELKEHLMDYLRARGIEVMDQGTHGTESVDYPDYAHAVSDTVQRGVCERGILICGSGNGVNIVANKHKGVRSALAWDHEVARLARAHNNANVLALPARFMSQEEARRCVEAFLSTPFEGGRHERRVLKIEP